MSRIKFVSFYLLLSLAIVSLTLLLIITFWYPDIHAKIPGFIKIVYFLFFVDITLGPLLSTIVYKPKKPSLRFDLTVIALIQISALIYGIITLANARPVYMVFNIDRFTAVSVNDISEQDLNKAPPEYQSFSYLGPVMVGAPMPKDFEAKQALITKFFSTGADLAQSPEYYVPYEKVIDEVKSKLKPLKNLAIKNPENKKLIGQAVLELKTTDDKIGYIPVIVKSQDFIAIISRSDAKILKYLPLDGW